METKYPRAVRIQQRAIAILRIATGLCFLYLLWGQLGAGLAADMSRLALSLSQGHPVAWYADFLRLSVADGGMGYAYFLMLSELVVGAFLVLGLFTAPAALLGLAIAVCLGLAFAGQGVFAVACFVGLSAVLAFLSVSFAGLTWGVDRALLQRDMPYWFMGLWHYEYREF